MFCRLSAIVVGALFFAVTALRYDPVYTDYNLNQNQTAVYPVDYWGEWDNHTYNPSPDNWRFPFYTLTLDRFVDGDPTNNDANGTLFEHDWMTNQFRFGGDTRGLLDSLDYVQGMGIKGLYLAGSPFINMPWSGDGYGPLDFTLLDKHHGVIDDWRALITEIHNRDMYIILDNTMATMGDLIGFQGFVNATAPFNWHEYDYVWKSDRRYHDFSPGNAENTSCQYPRMWNDDGDPIGADVTSNMDGCRESEFDQYGDMKSMGVYPSWQSQLSKFASVRDRLRAWRDDVREKIKVMSCIQIAMLDIDGFRMDKSLQTTVDAQADFSASQRTCARKYGKKNFLVVGEVVGETPLASIYYGRGKEPEKQTVNVTESMLSSSASDPRDYVREFGLGALDGGAFHYPTYYAMTRFLGLDGMIGFESVDFVDHWTKLMQTDDMVNSNTGKFDPRHMFGVTNQDVFRWPSLSNGVHRQLLGLFITTLEMPGIPLLLWGEEQEFYVLENLASDYVFGRTPMASQRAWQLHGCYQLGEQIYYQMPFNSSGYACHDDSVSLDHRDPSHPIRNIIKRMHELRLEYPVLNDGYELKALSSQTHDVWFPGSAGLPSPFGIWSVYRGRAQGIQNFTGQGQGNQGVWFVYHNEETTVNYFFDCSNSSAALISAFPVNTTVKNLFYPYEEFTLEASNITYGIENSSQLNGCLSNLTMAPWDHKAFVPKSVWRDPSPTITGITPGHDDRIQSSVGFDEQETVPIQIRFSKEMDCNSVANSLQINSTSQNGQIAGLSVSSIQCSMLNADPPRYVGAIASAWAFNAQLVNVSNGVHTITVYNATAKDGSFTNTRDHFMFRIGQLDNPIVFPMSANYTSGVLQKYADTGNLYIVPRAPGADKFRYSLNWGSSWSDWLVYTGENTTLTPQPWFGTKAQEWAGEHVILNYWSQMTGSSEHIQHSDLDREGLPPRRWPHVFVEGLWNQYGYDNGLHNEMRLNTDGLWEFDLMAEWPTEIIINVWGMNPDGFPDKTKAFGDIDGDGVLDWVPPDSLSRNVINISDAPPMPYLGYHVVVNDGSYNYSLQPAGSAWNQLVVSILIGLVPLITGITGVYLFKKSFYQVKFNQIGVPHEAGFTLSTLLDWSYWKRFAPWRILSSKKAYGIEVATPGTSAAMARALAADTGAPNRRTVLIATMEYEIDDWNIKVKIGGLGVMASLMAKNLGHEDLIWVVPCVGDINYPIDRVGEVMAVTILGNNYEIEVQYHKLRNITFVLLDAPVFRRQTKKEPYPARMDDLDSAIFYSAWNSCIAKALKRFNVDLYHINDYHGAVAPLHLLPRTIPVCLSLHNAEFQGLWPLRTAEELDEICRVFNLPEDIVKKYVQFGEVFNLLHAGASYLRIHQKGFGAVGVSKKYGKRSFARYPIFWGLHSVGALPNPDPSDTAEWSRGMAKKEASAVAIDEALEAKRGNLRRQAQEWAGLDVDPTAELFVFVGRWSMQKGVDLIADVFFSVLEENPKAQLICVGPVIDLYGKFAALKLAKLMAKWPGRVCSKPEFTMLPPYIFSGAEFALIPSRDEPFGLVAVEFGRKGALGVGSRVGGLGQMPGWWYTIESTTTKHLIIQFKSAIRSALASKNGVRSVMRARSALQRFPVAQWVEDLEILQSRSIKIHEKQASTTPSIFHFPGLHGGSSRLASREQNALPTAMNTATNTVPNSMPPSRAHSRVPSPSGSPIQSRAPSPIPEDGLVGPDETAHGPTRKASSRRRSRLRKGGNLSISRNSSISSLKDSSEVASVSDHVDLPSHPIPEADETVSLDITRSNSLQLRDRQSHDYGSQSPQSPHSPHSPRAAFSFPRSWFAQHDWIMSPPLRSPAFTPAPSRPNTPPPEEATDPFSPPYLATKSKSVLSLESIVGEQANFNLQKVDPFFTDTTGVYYNTFEKMLDSVDSKTSEDKYCIERFLIKSEKDWFGQRHNVKLGRSAFSSPAPSIFRAPRSMTARGSDSSCDRPDTADSEGLGQFNLGQNFVPIKGIQKVLATKIGDWPVYAFLLAFGQIIAANSYQINLLTGENGQTALKLYIVAAIYIVASFFWWIFFRNFRSVYVVSLPFAIYGMAFLLLGVSPYTNDNSTRGWIYNVATGMYAFASASGSFYFALNFGSEGGAPVQSWVFRACAIQGTQQIYVVALWYWGSTLTRYSTAGGVTSDLITSTSIMTAITVPIAVFMWAVGLVLFKGLPSYYRQEPGEVPSFYTALLRRKIVLWFFVMVILQNYWLSAPYGRNWRYLFSSMYAPPWAIFTIIAFFFIFIWSLMLWFLGSLTRQHSWVLPIFAISLGAPRWCQMLWGTSNIGLYIPWASPMIGAVIGRSLWAWLGVLDAIQGVGLGMILLQTLTRVHIACTLVAAQVIGSAATIAARASAPDNIGPGDVFPDFSIAGAEGLRLLWFWIGLFCQILICVGFFAFFRKEQLSKP